MRYTQSTTCYREVINRFVNGGLASGRSGSGTCLGAFAMCLNCFRGLKPDMIRRYTKGKPLLSQVLGTIGFLSERHDTDNPMGPSSDTSPFSKHSLMEDSNDTSPRDPLRHRLNFIEDTPSSKHSLDVRGTPSSKHSIDVIHRLDVVKDTFDNLMGPSSDTSPHNLSHRLGTTFSKHSLMEDSNDTSPRDPLRHRLNFIEDTPSSKHSLDVRGTPSSKHSLDVRGTPSSRHSHTVGPQTPLGHRLDDETNLSSLSRSTSFASDVSVGKFQHRVSSTPASFGASGDFRSARVEIINQKGNAKRKL